MILIKSNLPILMAQHGIRTLSKVVEQTNLSRTTLTTLYYSKGKGIQFDTMDALCEMFDVSVGELLERIPDKTTGSECF